VRHTFEYNIDSQRMQPLHGNVDFQRMHTATWQPDLARANGSATHRDTEVEPASLQCLFLMLLCSLVPRKVPHISWPDVSSTLPSRWQRRRPYVFTGSLARMPTNNNARRYNNIRPV